jgi:hypothetical protein
MSLSKKGLGVACFVVVMGVAATAWACTAQVGLSPLLQQSGPQGTQLSVSGQTIGGGEVEIRWNGVRGPVIGTALTGQDGGANDFTAQVTIPEATPGVYYLVAAAENGQVSRAAFEVTPSDPAATPAVAPRVVGSQPNVDNAWNSQGPGPADASTSPGLVAGMGLLAVGMVALFSAFGVAAVHRHRSGRVSANR